MNQQRRAELYLMLDVHFAGQEKNFPNISCETCHDKKSGYCKGNGYKGEECVECMARNPHVRVHYVGSKGIRKEVKKYYRKYYKK